MKRLISLILVIILLISCTSILAFQTYAADDYPYRGGAIDATDNWRFCTRECTSFCAWRLNNNNGVAFTNYYGGVTWGDAKDWGYAASRIGIAVNMTPAVGAIAWWNNGTYGHVAWVSAVNGSSVTIEEYNYPAYSYNYNSRTISSSSVSGYIHIKDMQTDKTPPSISDFYTYGYSAESFLVTADITDSSGIKSVQYAVWTTANGQDELKWYDTAITSENHYTARIYFSEHNNEKDGYVIDVYATDNAGNVASSRIGYTYDTTGPTISDFYTYGYSAESFLVTADITDSSGIKSVQYAVWTTENGQDDLKWYDTAITSENHYTARIYFSEHNNEKGTYIIDMYAKDNAGNETRTRISYTFPTIGPEISNVQVSAVSSKGYRVSCTVKAASGLSVSKVRFPTWTSNNGQDDLIWEDGEIKNGSQATFYVSASEHNNEKGPYITHIYAYDAIGNSTNVSAGTTKLTDAPILVDSYTVDNKKAIESVLSLYERLGLTKPTTYTETTYKVYNSGKSWELAKQWCESQGGHLATITSSTEQTNVETVLSKFNGVQCWLGAKRIDGTWTWVTGESFSYTHWDSDQPDNCGGNEIYLGTYNTGNYLLCYKWNDFPSTDTKVGGFVCEIEKKYCLEHSWDSGTTTKAATCTQAGSKLFHCSKCEKTYTEEIPATGHDYEDVVTLPTMESEGYTTHTCRTCSHSFVDSNVPALTGSAYYIVPALVRQRTVLTIKCADEEYTLNAENGIFETSELPEGDYTVYAKQKNSLRVCLGTYQTQTGEYINNDAVTLPIGDVNSDDVIDIADLSMLLSTGNYGNANTEIDLTGDGMITIDDISTALAATNFGKSSVAVV